MIGQAINVRELAGKLLDAIVEHFTGAPDAFLPARRLIVPGDPRSFAWDCEQLTVSLLGIGWGQAIDATNPTPLAGGPASAMALRHATYAITWVRCTPAPNHDGSPPSLADLDLAGRESMRVAGLLSQALVEFTSRLRQELPPEGLVQPGLVEPVGPSGGFHALESTLSITAARLE